MMKNPFKKSEVPKNSEEFRRKYELELNKIAPPDDQWGRGYQRS